MKVPILKPTQNWTCPNCTHTWVTHEAQPHSVMHNCRGLKGLSAPMVPAGTRCKVEAKEREDYVGKQIVTKDGEGTPIMSIVTTRDEGQDCAVLAPCAEITERK